MNTLVQGFTINYSDGDGPRFINDIFNKGEYDQALQNLVILDIGAHVGIFSMYAYRFAKVIYAVEPDPDNYALLTQNIQENKLYRIKPVRCAMWKTTGIVGYKKNSTSGGGMVSESESTTVQSYTLADFVAEYKIPKIDIIKCDTEGAESAIFFDPPSEPILAAASTIVFEHGQHETTEFFRKLGFRIVSEGRVTTVCKR